MGRSIFSPTISNDEVYYSRYLRLNQLWFLSLLLPHCPLNILISVREKYYVVKRALDMGPGWGQWVSQWAFWILLWCSLCVCVVPRCRRGCSFLLTTPNHSYGPGPIPLTLGNFPLSCPYNFFFFFFFFCS